MFGTKKIASALTERAGRIAYESSVAALKAAGTPMATGFPKAEKAMEEAMRIRALTAQSSARKMVYGGMGVAAAGNYAGMRHHSGRNSTPSTRTARGVGRYA